jgi:hypothetical protein
MLLSLLLYLLIKKNLRIYVSSPVAAAYRSAVAASNTQANLTQALDFTYLGIKMVLMSRNAWSSLQS